MGKGSGITRGDRRRNAKKARLRALVPEENAVAGAGPGGEEAGAGGDRRRRRGAGASLPSGERA